MAGRNSIYKEPAIIVCELVLQHILLLPWQLVYPTQFAVSLESRLVSCSQPLPLQARGKGRGWISLDCQKKAVLIVFNEDHCILMKIAV